MFVVLMIVCFVFAWVPLLTMSQRWMVCSACGTRMG